MIEPKTPLPWIRTPDPIGSIVSSKVEYDGDAVCVDLFDQDTEFILKSCNNYHRLMEENARLKKQYSDHILKTFKEITY